MYQVGNNQGYSHRQREGTGLAHILTGPDTAVDTYGRIWALDEAKIARRDAAAAAKRAEAIKGLKEFAPEYSYRYRAEIQPKIEAHIQKGAEMLARNIDPFTGVDPESEEWQKEHQSIQADAKHSMQTQSEIAAIMQDMDGKDADKYTTDSWQSQLDWMKMSLEQKRNAGPRPPLRLKTAWQDGSEFIGKNMKLWESGHAGASPAEVEDFVTSLLQQPANAPIVQAYAQKYSELPANEKTRIDNAAKDGGREVYQQLALEDGLRWQKGKEPFDYQKEIDSAVKTATSRVGTSEWQKGNISGEGPKGGKKAVMAQARNIAEDMFRSRAEWLTFYERNGELPRGKSESDPDYYERAVSKTANEIYERMRVDSKYKVSDKGADDQKKKETSDLFVADLTGDDMNAANSAANLLTGTTFASNLKIEDAAVNRAPDYSTVMRLGLTTPMTLSQIKKTIVDEGVAEDQVEIIEKEGKKTALISFRPGEGGKQSAARLYDNFMKETGAVYEPKHTDRETPPAPAAPTPKPGTVNFDSFFKK